MVFEPSKVGLVVDSSWGSRHKRQTQRERDFFLQTREEKSAADGEEDVGVSMSTTMRFFKQHLTTFEVGCGFVA